MSQWTHVNGSIRFDLFAIGSPMREPNMAYGVPEGSEGPLTVSKIDVYRTDHQAFVTVGISGDLRDFGQESVQSIIDWLNKHTEGQMIRSGLVEIDVEYSDTLILKYDDKTSKFEVIHTIGE